MINHEQQPYLSLRDKLSGIFIPSVPKEEFWALKDVSFDINHGESIGVIGKNGAGKSTLLKILSKITPPTSGKIISRGRIASLLEVGTGFHAELTGRENVFFNGAILGMRRSEIKRKFDEIVEFAGVEKFIDTPLKHYSSGMQLRLAFAVAAFLEAEILVVDEVLAVGDAEFQKKCLGKMEDVTKNEGRTVLFVSHNMGILKDICKKGIYLKSGKIQYLGDISHSISAYLESNSKVNCWISDKGMIRRISYKVDDSYENIVYAGCDLKIEIEFVNEYNISFPVIGLIFRDEFNQSLLGINNLHFGKTLDYLKEQGKIIVHLPFFPLYKGYYSIDVYFGDKTKDYEIIKSAISFSVDKNKTEHAEYYLDEKLNKVYIKNAFWIFS